MRELAVLQQTYAREYQEAAAFLAKLQELTYRGEATGQGRPPSPRRPSGPDRSCCPVPR